MPLDASIGANVTTVIATDPDDGLNAEIRLATPIFFVNFDVFSYTLAGNDHFAIDSHSGLVSVVKAFGNSARTLQTYKLTVTAADMGMCMGLAFKRCM